MTSEMIRISEIRSAATWMRKSAKPLDQYPKRDKLDERMRIEAQQFAAGILPWPARWTVRLYGLATAG
ncbi:MAG TPA: hypothetical protein VGR71_16900 [Nitrospira sp.]|nr:hypothetical protein [Nitrospira sp.]